MTDYGKSYYEEYEAGRYSELKEKRKEWYTEVLSLAGVSKGDGRGLDIGCAYGYSLDVLHDLGFDPFGMDVSEHAVRRGKNIHNFPLAVGDVEEGIPFDGDFSLIMMVGVLEHLKNPELAISNVHDKLREGGIFVASTPNPDWWRKWFGLAPEDETHKHEWMAEKWRKILRNFDWENLEVKIYQTIPLLWRLLEFGPKVEFRYGEITVIRGLRGKKDANENYNSP